MSRYKVFAATLTEPMTPVNVEVRLNDSVVCAVLDAVQVVVDKHNEAHPNDKITRSDILSLERLPELCGATYRAPGHNTAFQCTRPQHGTITKHRFQLEW